MKRYYIGVLLVVISASCFALMPIFTVFAYKGNANFTTILFLRFGIAALLLFTYLACKKRNLAVNRKVLFKLLIIGGILYTLQSSLYFASIKYINVSLQAMLFYTYPIFVTILAVAIFKESFTKILLVSIAVSLTGMGMVLGTSFENINFLGVFLALAAAAVYSLYINLANRLVQDIPSDLATAYICMFSSLAFLLVGTLSNNLSFDFCPSAWWPIIAIAFFSTTVSIVTLFLGMEILGSTRAAIISIIEPFITIIISSLLFHDRLGLLQWLGGFLILVGAYVVVKFRSEPNAEVSEFPEFPH